MDINWPIAVIAFGGALAFILWDQVRPWWRDRRTSMHAKQAFAQWLAEQPPVIEPDGLQMERLKAALPGLALPALRLTPDLDAAIEAGGTRIGGPVWLADDAVWPVGKDGRPLEFVAQLDFAAMPPLEDYPSDGLLQLFIGRDDLHGANFDAPLEANIRLIWHPDGPVGGRLVPPPRLPRYDDPDDDGYASSPFTGREREQGVPLRAKSVAMMPQPLTYAWEGLLRDLGIDGRADAVDAMAEDLWNDHLGSAHHVGGHPVFTQTDYRCDLWTSGAIASASPYRAFDRVLFQLTSGNGLQWGDMGEANLMIRHADLLACRFDQVIWWWDCS